MMEKLSKNFSLDELTYSATANRLHIDNTPTPEIKDKLTTLCQTLLQPIRDAWRGAIVVTSGYRSPEVNKAVGGARTSQHMIGEAADLKVGDKERNKRLFNMIVKLMDQGKIQVGQLIDEYNYSWVHVSLPRQNKPNNQILHLR